LTIGYKYLYSRVSEADRISRRFARCAEGAFRVLYVAKFAGAVYVLHAFQKKTQKTSSLDIELARTRYKALVRSLKK
jgi:phage-related protein